MCAKIVRNRLVDSDWPGSGGGLVTDNPIPVLEVSGSHREVGRQIGAKMAPALQHLASDLRTGLPQGVRWADVIRQSQLYLSHSQAVYPQYVEEVVGLAEGADLAFEELFPGLCEELWEPAAWRGRAPHSASPGVGSAMRIGGCTDFAARGRAVVDGSTLLAHTNDLEPAAEQDLILLKVQAGDEPQFLAVSPAGLGYSAGFNAAGISLTGNQVSCNDIRPGIPRFLVVRAILAARRLEEAMDACLLPRRASSYNNVIADTHGEVYSMEGSATGCVPIYIEGDILAHANHYMSPAMLPFEADPNDIGGSVIRHNRAMRLLRENYGRLSPDLFQRLLSDHQNYPGSICKHGLETVTVFSLIINLNERIAWVGRGRPCETTYTQHVLEPWTLQEDQRS
jgi:isopenicillin-N N-acyltransferase-like protein